MKVPLEAAIPTQEWMHDNEANNGQESIHLQWYFLHQSRRWDHHFSMVIHAKEKSKLTFADIIAGTFASYNIVI